MGTGQWGRGQIVMWGRTAKKGHARRQGPASAFLCILYRGEKRRLQSWAEAGSPPEAELHTRISATPPGVSSSLNCLYLPIFLCYPLPVKTSVVLLFGGSEGSRSGDNCC